MFIAASIVFDGDEPLIVVAENNCVHAELEAPLDVVHPFRTFANAFNCELGAEPFAGNEAPGALPVVGFTRFIAVAAARAIPLLLVAVAPICAPVAKNGAIAQAAATVVASFTMTLAPLFSAEHCPSTAVITAALFDEVEAPADPPCATRYNTELLYGQAPLFAIVKAPFESVVRGEVSRGAGADPLPIVPAV
jgi:hypothetical protein